MSHPHQDRHALDPSPGEWPRFSKSGTRWLVGNRPTRLAVVVMEDAEGQKIITEYDPVTWETVESDAA